MERYSGFLIAIEGIDGCGKSTLTDYLVSKLPLAISTREPGGTKTGQLIRSLVRQNKMANEAEFLLFAADRAQHIQELVIPALKKGHIVISDRMADSSYAYQGYGRGLDLNILHTINNWAMNGITPDITIYIALNPAQARKRIILRQDELDIFEQEEIDFIQRVHTGFEILFENRPDVLQLNGTLSAEILGEQALTYIYTFIQRKSA